MIIHIGFFIFMVGLVLFLLAPILHYSIITAFLITTTSPIGLVILFGGIIKNYNKPTNKNDIEDRIIDIKKQLLDMSTQANDLWFEKEKLRLKYKELTGNDI